MAGGALLGQANLACEYEQAQAYVRTLFSESRNV